MRQRILALEVEADREFGIMDIGKTVDFNPETRLFELSKIGYTVVAYATPRKITVDFTPLRRAVPLNVELETVEALLKFFDERVHHKQAIIEFAEEL